MERVAERRASLPVMDGWQERPDKDWLVRAAGVPATVHRDPAIAGTIIASNGLVARMFSTVPNGATLDIVNLMTGESIVRAVRPEARVSINGTWHEVGGLRGQEEHAYTKPDWIPALTTEPGAFQLVDFTTGPIAERFTWKRCRHASSTTWPPRGIDITFTYEHHAVPGIAIDVHHEIHDGIPLLAKWLVVRNNSQEPIVIDAFVSEILAVVESDSTPQGDPGKSSSPAWGPMHVESDFIFSAMSPATGNVTTTWEQDPAYTSQVAFMSDARLLLESKPPLGPAQVVEPGGRFESFRTWELIHDSTCRERRSLAQRKMYRTVAPWITENPIFMHCTNADPRVVKQAIDQCVETGFEMIIISFGSGLNMEWADIPEYIDEYRELFEHAREQGIEIGGYSLFSSRSIDAANDVVPPPGTSPTFGHAPCLCSGWGRDYVRQVKAFLEQTGATFLEHDGPYPGDPCASTSHPGHQGLADSQWNQWCVQADLYRWCRERGIYVNQPDWYFMNGGNKTGMGYKEVNWSLPRERQVMLARQNIHDGTWEKTPSMGWLFTPLTVYHPVGDWKRSTLEPLDEHLDFYEAHLAQNFLSGVQSCYRGTRLYDTPRTRDVVKRWVTFFKQHREVLEADIIHVRRPDGRHVDGILHANPGGKEPGFVVLYNPLDEPVTERVVLDLYYTGLDTTATLTAKDGTNRRYTLSRSYSIDVNVSIEARGIEWFVITA